MLNITSEGETQLFDHSRYFETGQGKVRPGQATVTVALDGSGDCDTIQEGLKRLPTAGGVVYVKEGIYKIQTPILITKSNVYLCGAGKATQIQLNDASAYIYINTVNYVTVKDIYVKNISGTTDGAVEVEAAQYTVLESLWIEDATSSGIYVVNTGIGFRIQNCSILDSGTNSITCDNSNYPIICNNFLTDAVKGISGSYIKHGVIVGNVISTITEDGIYLSSATCDENIIVSNMFLTMTADAIHIQDVGASKNIIVANSYVGFSLTDNGAGTVISGNAT